MKKLKAAAAVLLAAVMIMAVSVTAFAKMQTPFDNSEFFEYGDYSVHYRVFEAKGDFRGRIMMLHGFGWLDLFVGADGEAHERERL